jgi:hypothetical protein
MIISDKYSKGNMMFVKHKVAVTVHTSNYYYSHNGNYKTSSPLDNVKNVGGFYPNWTINMGSINTK